MRLPMSAIGTKRTSLVALHMSAFGGKADIGWIGDSDVADVDVADVTALALCGLFPHRRGLNPVNCTQAVACADCTRSVSA